MLGKFSEFGLNFAELAVEVHLSLLVGSLELTDCLLFSFDFPSASLDLYVLEVATNKESQKQKGILAGALTLEGLRTQPPPQIEKTG